MDLTIKDVAKIAGVSAATVSRVMNGTKPVNPETQQKVLQAIEKTGFKRNAAARSLVVRKSNLLGVLIPDISNIYFVDLIKGIDAESHYYGYNIIVTDFSCDEQREIESLNLLLEKGVDGIIFTAHNTVKKSMEDIINNSGIPFVSLNRVYKNAMSIRVDNYKESYDAVMYLIGLGHRHIGFISGSFEDTASGIERLKGYRQALTDGGIQYSNSLVCEGDYTYKSGYNAAEKLLISNKGISAMFAANDEMAFGAMALIEDKGMKVPQDISLIGFDDISYSSYIRPRLTTVHQPIYEIGELAAKMLIKYVNKEKIEENDVVLKGGIVVRDSTARAK